MLRPLLRVWRVRCCSPWERMLEIDRLSFLALAIAALYLGRWCNRTLPLLRAWHIPPAVTGGLLGNIMVAAACTLGQQTPHFTPELRDILLLAFFCTVGLGAKLQLLLRAQRLLWVLLWAAVVFLLLQNAIGLAIARLLGAAPAYGLLAGSVAFAGGHGTALGWGQFLGEQLPDAAEYGVAAATIGLLVGGWGGGAIARYAIENHNLCDDAPVASTATVGADAPDEPASGLSGLLGALLAVVLGVRGGNWAGLWLQHHDILCPAFLPVTLVGVVLGNGLDKLQRAPDPEALRIWSELSLQLFLTMSLLGLQFGTLGAHAGLLLATASAQVLATLGFGYWAIFPAAGRDYEASVVAAGFVGVGLGATPVGMANMQAVIARYGGAPQALVVVPLVWGVFADIINAGIVRGLLALVGF